MIWLYPSFLWALFALAIPLIIHLFNFRRYKRIIFPDIRFLKQVQTETKSGNKLKRFLILLSRLLAVFFLVCAFAQPLLLHDRQALDEGSRTGSIILDNSYSMNLEGSEGPLLEAAKNRARAIINASSNNDRFNIISSDMNPSLLHFMSKQAALDNIDKIKITSSASKLSALMDLQKRLLSQVQGSKTAFIISDFQKVNTDPGNSACDSGFRQTWVVVKGGKNDNLSIDTCFLSSPVIQPGQNINLVVQASNFTETLIEGSTIELSIDGKPKGIASFDIKPYSSAKQSINFTLEGAGNHNCELKLQGDNIPVDDKLYFSLNVRDNYNVTGISDIEEPYVQAVFDANPGYTYKKELSGVVNYGNFKNNSLILLQGINNINSGFSSELRKFVSNGGTAFVFPDPEMKSGGLQDLASGFGFSISTDPVIASLKVSTIDLEHPVFTHIFEKKPKNPDLPAVSKYFNIQAPNGTSIMKLANGNTFLTDISSGKGHLIICAAALTSEFSNFQNHALFVPVLLKSAMLSDYRRELYFDCGSAKSIYTGLPYEAESGLYMIKDKTSLIPEVINMEGELYINTNAEINEPGHYALKNKRSDSTLAGLSFNINRSESDTRLLEIDEISKMASVCGASLYEGSAENLGSEYAKAEKGVSLWKWCIILVLIFLLIEILLIRFLKTHAKLPS